MLCKTIFLLVIAHFTIGAVIEAPVDYSQHKIVRILPNRVKQLNVLEKIKTNFNVSFKINFQFYFYESKLMCAIFMKNRLSSGIIQ
jgi:hypothetical protein